MSANSIWQLNLNAKLEVPHYLQAYNDLYTFFLQS